MKRSHLEEDEEEERIVKSSSEIGDKYHGDVWGSVSTLHRPAFSHIAMYIYI